MVMADEDMAVRAERAMTIKQFCAIENISKATYYKMRRAGLGPEETTVPIPGMTVVRITQEARRAWHQKLREVNATKAAQLERERFRATRQARGLRSVTSPKHVSHRKRRRRKGGDA
jgi:hypothetical protein